MITYMPHPYQQRAYNWILDNPRCCLFLDMGLGKTVVTLSAVQTLLDSCEIERALVVAPKKVAETTWTGEQHKWMHLRDLRVQRVIGTPKQREDALAKEADVYVIGRDSYVWLANYYNGRMPFDMIILDELTSFKSNKSKRFKAMRLTAPAVQRVVGLTGTPAPNGLADLWAEMYCVDGGQRLGKSVTRFREQFFHSVVYNGITIKYTPKRGTREILQELLRDVCLTMKAEDYLTLPDVITINTSIALPPDVQRAYNDFERENVLAFVEEENAARDTIVAFSQAALLNKLSQFANGAVYDESHEPKLVHGEKVEKLKEIVEASTGGVLVFYQYRHDITRIQAALKKYRIEVFDATHTADILNRWNAGEIDVLLAHPASTAYGLNMQQGGYTIVWFGTGWNLELYQQANARLHRQGQQHPVTIYRLLVEGTIDETMAKAIDNKDFTQDKLLESLKDKYV